MDFRIGSDLRMKWRCDDEWGKKHNVVNFVLMKNRELWKWQKNETRPIDNEWNQIYSGDDDIWV